jgi:RNA polymerase Rpb4
MEKSGKSSFVKNNDDNVDGSTVDPLPSSSLLTNLAVLELLQPRVEQRRQQQQEEGETLCGENAKRKQRKRRKSLRHRDWIEEQVVDYIRKSATVQFQSSKHALPLQMRLQKRSRKRKPSTVDDPTATKATNESDNSTALALSSSLLCMNGIFPSTDDASMHILEEEEEGNEETFFDFTEAEAIQVINFSPREPVDLHILIDDLSERLSVQQQEECLSLIQQYRALPRGSTLNANTATTASATVAGEMLRHDSVLNDDANAIVFQDSNHVAIKMEEDDLPSYFQDDDPPVGGCFGDWTISDRKPAAR